MAVKIIQENNAFGKEGEQEDATNSRNLDRRDAEFERTET